MVSPSERLGALDRWLLVGVMVFALAVVSLAAVTAVRSHFHISVVDDYHAGYEIGALESSGGAQPVVDTCRRAMVARYGTGSQAAEGGRAFRVGCEDAVQGQGPVSWMDVRERLIRTSD